MTLQLQKDVDAEKTAEATIRLGRMVAAVLTTREPMEVGVVDDDGNLRTLLVGVTDVTQPPQRCPSHPHGGPCEAVAEEPWRCVYGYHFMPGVKDEVSRVAA